MYNYKLIVQYDGTGYAGWQIQNNAMSVQQKISDSLEILLKEKVNLIGAGRTDTGVHALGQTANFKSDKTLDTFKLNYQLNAILPDDISIVSLSRVPDEFHSRFDAKRRSYIYLITRFKSPFLKKYSYAYKGDINIELLNELSKAFLGKHNFTSFSKKNSDTLNKICNIESIQWKETKGVIVFYIAADRFLHGMVRTIVGTLLKTCKENLDADYIKSVFDKNNRDFAGEAVPGCGLFLYKVKY